MLEWLVAGNGLYALAGLGVVGILFRYLASCGLRHMTTQIAKGKNSKNKALQQMKNRFENLCQLKEEGVGQTVFVQKQTDQLKLFGVRLTTWVRLSEQMLLVELLAGGLAASGCWFLNERQAAVLYGSGTVLFFLTMLFFYRGYDVKRRQERLSVYLEDYLVNLCATHLQRGRINRRVEEKPEEQEADAQPQIAATSVTEEKKEPPKKKKRVLTEEESRLIEDILQEYLE